MQRAFILHRYRQGETSVLLKVWLEHEGVFAIIARGARRPKSIWRALCQPFIPVLINYGGRGSVKTLKQLESAAPHFMMDQKALACGLYVNELLVLLLPEKEPAPELFEAYIDCLSGLMRGDLHLALRQFEHALLRNLGVMPPLSHDEQGDLIVGNQAYLLSPGALPVKTGVQNQYVYPGHILKLIDQGNFSCKDSWSWAKRLHQQWLDHYSSGKVLKSREFLKDCYE